MIKWLSLILGSALGGTARYACSGVVYRVFGTGFPYGTLLVNLLGCFIIGVLVVLSEEKMILSSNARLLLMVGFCGAFTTFSTFIMETAYLVRDGQSMSALSNIIISVVIGFLVFRFGVLIGEWI